MSGSGRLLKGTANGAEVGTAACKSRAVSTVRADPSVTGYHRYYGEERAGRCLPLLKSVSDVSVWKDSPQGNAARARLVWGMPTGCIRHGYATSTTRLGRSSAQPGIQLTTYGAMGWFIEQENLSLITLMAPPMFTVMAPPTTGLPGGLGSCSIMPFSPRLRQVDPGRWAGWADGSRSLSPLGEIRFWEAFDIEAGSVSPRSFVVGCPASGLGLR